MNSKYHDKRMRVVYLIAARCIDGIAIRRKYNIIHLSQNKLAKYHLEGAS